MTNYVMPVGLFDTRTSVRGVRSARILRAEMAALGLTGRNVELTPSAGVFPGPLPATGTFYPRSVISEGRTINYQVFVPASSVATPPFKVLISCHSAAERHIPNLQMSAGGVLPQYIGYPTDTNPYPNVNPYGINRWPVLSIFPQVYNAGVTADNIVVIHATQAAMPAIVAATKAEWNCDNTRWGLTGQSAGGVQLFPLIWMMPTQFAWVQCMSACPAERFFRSDLLPGWPGTDLVNDQGAVDFIVPIMADNGIAFRMRHGSLDPSNTAIGSAISPSIATYYSNAGIPAKYNYLVDNPAAALSVGEQFDHGSCWNREMAYADGYLNDLFLQHR